MDVALTPKGRIYFSMIKAHQKTAEQKNASIVGHALQTMAGHAAQNALAHGAMAIPLKGNPIHTNLMQRVAKDKVSGVGRNFIEGVAGGLVPEFKIMNNEAGHFGKELYKKLQEQGANLTDHASKRDLVQLRRLMAGKFDNLAKTKHGQQYLRTLFSTINDDAGKLFDMYANTPGLADDFHELVRGAAQDWKKNKFLGNLGRGVARNMDAATLKSLMAGDRGPATRLERGSAAAGEFLGNAFWYKVDPLVPAVNIAKRVMASKAPATLAAAGEKMNSPVARAALSSPKKLVDKSNDIFVTKPFANAFNSGLEGKSLGDIKQFAERYAFNYATEGISKFLNDFGGRLRNAGVTKDILQKVRNKEISIIDAVNATREAKAQQAASSVIGSRGNAMATTPVQNVVGAGASVKKPAPTATTSLASRLQSVEDDYFRNQPKKKRFGAGTSQNLKDLESIMGSGF